MADKYNFVYTRYADDLTFSTTGEYARIGQILKHTNSIVDHEGFKINESKTRVLRSSRQQEVTGIVVNDKLNVDRKTLKRFRATLHQIEQNGFDNVNWGKGDDVMASIEGYARFVMMVNPQKGRSFLSKIQQIKQKLPNV